MTTRELSATSPSPVTEALACRHHWVIEAPTGPISRGSCRRCGQTQEFNNIIETAPWVEEGGGAPGEDPMEMAMYGEAPDLM